MLHAFEEMQYKKKTKNYQNLPPARGVGYFNRFQGCLLPYTNTGTVQEIHEISQPGQVISFQGTAIRTVHSSHGVHCDSQGGKINGHTQGYKNPPVPRRLVGESQVPPSSSPAYTGTSKALPEFRLAGDLEKSEPKQVFALVGYQFDLRSSRVRPTPDWWQTLQQKAQELLK